MLSRKPTKSAALSAMIFAALPGTCATTTDTGATRPIEVRAAQSSCLIFKPIGWVGADTDGTIADIKEHNRVFKGLCA